MDCHSLDCRLEEEPRRRERQCQHRHLRACLQSLPHELPDLSASDKEVLVKIPRSASEQLQVLRTVVDRRPSLNIQQVVVQDLSHPTLLAALVELVARLVLVVSQKKVSNWADRPPSQCTPRTVG